MNLRKEIDSLDKRITKEISTINERMVKIETEIKPTLELVNALWEGVLKLTASRIFDNPVSKERIKELFDKFEKRTLSSEEMKELKQILESELEKAKKKRETSLIVNLTILLAVLEGKMKIVEDQIKLKEEVEVIKRKTSNSA